MPERLQVLLVEDNPADARLLEENLADAGQKNISIIHVERLDQVVEPLGREKFDAVLLDLGLPDSNGMETVVAMNSFAPHLPIVVLTGVEDDELGVLALRSGAQDYLPKKNMDVRSLHRAIRYAIERKQMEQELEASRLRLRLALTAGRTGTWEIEVASNEFRGLDDYAQLTLTPSKRACKIESHLGVIHPDDRRRVQEALQKTINEQMPYNLECRILSGDNIIRWVALRGETVCNEAGQCTRVLGAVVDITDLKAAQDQLSKLNEDLERRVANRTAELHRRARQLQGMALELTHAEQRERRRLSELLHDHLQQLLVAANYSVAALQKRVSDPNHKKELKEVYDLIGQSIQASRSLSVELSPRVLYEDGLLAALGWLANDMGSKYNITVEVCANCDPALDSDDLRILLFSAVRELLFNIAKHAPGAEQARIAVQQPSPDVLQITVSDTGPGFDPSILKRKDRSGGLGLFSIRERIDALGVFFALDSAPGKGCTVSLTIPTDSTIKGGRMISLSGQ